MSLIELLKKISINLLMWPESRPLDLNNSFCVGI